MPARRTPAATADLRASLIEHAQRLIRRDGAAALTMRALAAEANCAIGLPYTVFPNRESLVAELVRIELTRVSDRIDAWSKRAGRRTVGENLDHYASLLLDAETPILELARTLESTALDSAVDSSAHETGLARSFDTAVAGYLAAEQEIGRVAADVDVSAFGFLITGAIHNLVEAGSAYPRPDRRRLRSYLAAVADQLAPR